MDEVGGAAALVAFGEGSGDFVVEVEGAGDGSPAGEGEEEVVEVCGDGLEGCEGWLDGAAESLCARLNQ